MSPTQTALARAAAALRLAAEALAEASVARDDAPASRPEGFIGSAEAARRAGVAQDTIVSWISRRVLPATRIEGARGFKIRPSDLDAVLSGQSRGATPPDPVDLATERGRRLATTVPRGRGGEH